MLSVIRPILRPRVRWKPKRLGAVRKFSSQSFSSTSTPTSPFSALGGLPSELDKISPRFDVQPSQIRIIRSPTEFYDTLKTKILEAKRSIYLSTLYIGKSEHELIDIIRQALQRNPALRVSILTDALRGTREAPEPSCASLLMPLVSEFGEERVDIRMFHTPNLTGVRKAVVPKRINEGWGLQHMKLYGVDDDLIISGANLSTDYFTNRQDRYHLFSSASLSSYFSQVHSAICSLSFKVLPATVPEGYALSWPEENPAPSPLSSPGDFRARATLFLRPLVNQVKKDPLPAVSSTVVYPLLQFSPLLRPDTSTELPALRLILTSLASLPLAGSSWTFTAGYFNMTPSTKRLLLATNPSRGTVIAASPWANGFFGSKGVSGMLPDAYTLLSRRFLDAVRWRGLSDQITLKEWRRGTVNEPDGWSYHAKGLWVTLPGETAPSLSIVGSSNYTKRSYELDLEANVLIMTRDEPLMKRLGEEEQWLQEYATDVNKAEYEKPERQVGWRVKLAMWAVKVLGGAL